MPIETDCDLLNTFHSISTALYHSVLQSSTKYYSVPQSTTPYYKVLVQYYSVLQNTTQYYKAVLRYYWVFQSTTPYYLVLLWYYSLLQSTTQHYTKYYFGTSKFYSVLQSTTPVLFQSTTNRITKYSKALPCTIVGSIVATHDPAHCAERTSGMQSTTKRRPSCLTVATH